MPRAVKESRIDINHCSLADLLKLPQFNQKTAETLIKYRDMSGGFKSWDDFNVMPGFGTKKIDVLKNFCEIN